MIRISTLGLALGLLTAGSASAQSLYSVATNFGNNGKAIGPSPVDQGYIMTIGQQSTGKIIAGGVLFKPNFGPVDSAHLTRYKTNGVIDSTFGVNGNWGAQAGFLVQGIREVKVLASDKFLAMGKTVNSNLSIGYVARYNADGSRDRTYNSGAVTTMAVTGANFYPTTMVVQSTGKIIVGGQKYTNASMEDSTYLYRFNTDGTTDATFGTGGVYRMKNYYDYMGELRDFRIVVDAQDRIYIPMVTASTQPAPMCVQRLTANGVVDATYGTNGSSPTISLANSLSKFNLTLMPSGRLIASGITSGNQPNFIVNAFRLTASGQKDLTYGGNGTGVALFQTGPFSDYEGRISTIANGERLLMTFVTGRSNLPYAALMDIDTLGSPGTMFGGEDTLLTPMWPAQTPVNTDIVLQNLSRLPDNAIYSYGAGGDNFGFLLKYVTTPTGVIEINSRLALQAYPNPAGEVLHLRCAPGVTYALYDVVGREQLRGMTTQSETSLQIGFLPSGIYTLVCSKEGQNQSLTIHRN